MTQIARRLPTIALGSMFDREPPFSAESEASLLGAMILDPHVIPDVVGLVKGPEDFYLAEHGSIFRAITAVYDLTNGGDLVQIQNHLRGEGVYEQVGGETKLLELAEAVPAAVNAPHYARIVADKAQLRRIIDACGKGLYAAYHPGTGDGAVREVVDVVEGAIFSATEARGESSAKGLAEVLQGVIDAMEDKEKPRGIPTGFHTLDGMLCGLQPGEMAVLAARPSMGKTAFALNIAENVASRGIPTLLFSLEMSEEAIAQRLLSSRSRIPAQNLRRGENVDMRALAVAVGELSEIPLSIDDASSLSIMELRARTRRMVRKSAVGFVVIDYLQLLSAPHVARENRQVEVAAISRGIKALARELEVPILCLAQLNRASEQREGNRPRMADLRESGSIEQDADVVMLLHREEYYHLQDTDWILDNPDKAGAAEVIVAKQRNGPTGTADIRWDAGTTRFSN